MAMAITSKIVAEQVRLAVFETADPGIVSDSEFALIRSALEKSPQDTAFFDRLYRARLLARTRFLEEVHLH